MNKISKMFDLAVEGLACLAAVALLSMFVSFAHALANSHPCETKGRYLPVTYLLCKLSEPLEKK